VVLPRISVLGPRLVMPWFDVIWSLIVTFVKVKNVVPPVRLNVALALVPVRTVPSNVRLVPLELVKN
jgi:hypothetical protein